MRCCRFLRFPAAVAAALFLFWSVAAPAAVYTINTAADFGTLPATLQPGDVVLLKNGTFNNVQRTITAAGTVGNPVIFRAENPGQAFFSGSTRFTLRGTGMIISGLVFDGDVVPGGVNGSALFRFDLDSSDMVLRDVIINNFDTGNSTSPFYVLLNGYRHTIEYCRFSRKDSQKPVINIIPQEDDQAPAGTFPTKDVPRLHRVRYSYFGERTNIGDNEYETIRIGESKYQMYNMATVVEHCVFEKAIYGPDITNYEPEVISSKSRGNIYRYNTLIDCKGGIVLRHGDDCVVEGNFIFGEPGSNMGAGIRIIGMRHLIRNNYIQDVAGTGLRSPIVVMKGSSEYPENSTDNGYELPSFARILHNTIIHAQEPLQLGGTTSTSGSNLPRGVEIRGNVIVSRATDGPVLNLNGATLAPFTFENNFAHHAAGLYGDTLPAAGFTTGTPLLHAHDAMLGYTIPQPGSPVIGQAPATTPPTLRDVRGRFRAAPGDAGAFDTSATGAVLNRPLARADVGPSYDGRNSTAMAPLILTTPASRNALELGSTTFTVLAASAETLSYQWYRDEVPIAGATGASYTIGSIQLTDAASYTVGVTNASGTALTLPATLSVTPVRPVITQHPSSQFLPLGATASFTVGVTGEAPFTYVWRKNGDVIPGATAATLTLTNVQPADAGSYTVTVSNSYDSTTSQAAVLTLPAANQTLVVNESFNDGNRSNYDPPASLEWWSSSSASGLTVANGAMTQAATGSRHMIAHFPARTLALGETLELSFEFTPGSEPGNIAGGLRFALLHRDQRLAFTGDSQNPTNTFYPGYGVFTNLNPTSGSPTALRRRDTVTTANVLTSMTAYTTDLASGGTLQAFAANVKYRASLLLKRTSATEVQLTLAYSGGTVAVEQITGTDAANPLTTFDTVAIGIGSSGDPAVTALTIDNVVIMHTASDVPTPPTITSQPAAAAASVGDTVQFGVVAVGAAPLTYEWFRGTTPIPNSNAATLTLTNVQFADAGDYRVIVSNDLGSATSNTATLTVTAAPTPVAITAQPASLTRNVGEAATFSVTATGSAPISYQWRRNGADIPGATAATYAIASVLPGDAGDYTVFVSNAGGTATSNVATLLVNIPGGAVQIVADSFTDGNRTGQSPPHSLAWFVSAASSNATVTNGAVTITTSNSSRHFLAYFTPQSLAVGDALALDFDLRVTAPVNLANSFRVALMNSFGGDPRVVISADNNSPTVYYTGYGAFANPGPAPTTANTLTLRKRTASGTIITGGNYTQQVAGGATGQGFAADTDYHGKLTIERRGENELVLTITYTGGALSGHTLTWTDTSASTVTSFDALAFGVSTGTPTGGSTSAAGVASFTLDNVTIIYTPAPPPVASTGYAAWNETHFSAAERADATISGALADPDADGLSNLIEYALGLHPREGDSAAVPQATVADGFWTFSYTRPIERADVSYAVEVSTNLQTWTTDGVVHEQVATVGETATWQARYAVGSAATVFFRLRIGPTP